MDVEDINKIEIYHIEHLDGGVGNVSEEYEYVHCYCPIPKFLSWLPTTLQYIYLGLYLRVVLGNDNIIHAHNSSGYGLSAFLSATNYILTTYGSEVYRATYEKTSAFYKVMIRSILKNAKIITSSSPQMTSSINKLCKNLNVHEFSLGVSKEFFYSQSLRKSVRKNLNIPLDAVVIFSNRRLTRLYNIDVIVDSFTNISKVNDKLYLIQIEGDSDRDYARELTKKFKVENLVYIQGFLEQSELNSLLCASDYTISLPNTDQLSSSILEGISCNCLPILSNLEAYKPLCDISISVNTDLKSLENTFIDILNGEHIKKYDLIDKYSKKYSIDNAALKYRDILDEFNA